jgi:undecaprenyl-phosphate 4-deoxy-4-formamido-L-arabinose transferase
MNKTFEVIFVNDCSRDNSLNILQEIYSQYNNIIVVDLYTNFGQQNTLMCGFQYCQGQYIITMDDDLQNPPEEIQKLIEKLNEGYDAVFGTFTDKKDKFYKNWGSVLFGKFQIVNNIKYSMVQFSKQHTSPVFVELVFFIGESTKYSIITFIQFLN